MNKVITRNVYPPIPDRRFDWTAYYDGEEESNHAGWGATEAEAIADLYRLDQEMNEGKSATDELEAAETKAAKRNADRIDGYDRDDLGESPDY